MGYLALTPAHNEEKFLPRLIESILAQTALPKRWLIIDDGSTDRTGEIITSIAERHPWIVPHILPKRAERRPGGEAVVMNCLRDNSWIDCDFLLRCDADVTFEPDYISLLLTEFAKDDRLGIVSGCTHERIRGQWHPVEAPSFKTPGLCKFYSRVCFDAIGGLENGLGWDTIDDMRALMLGFKTRRLRRVPVYHHRQMGSATGLWRGRLRLGEAAYNAGYLPLLFIVRAIYHAFDRPYFMGGLLMLIGYLLPWLRHQPVLAGPQLVSFIRAQQWRRLTFSKTLWR
jgi:glycosyltransferase involved in cell wall biosynthesis